MPSVNFQNADGSVETVEIEVGDSVMRGARDNMVDGIEADCGGVGDLRARQRTTNTATYPHDVDANTCPHKQPPGILARSEAGILLAGTDDSIASIGRAVGWPEPAAFSRQFSKAFGVSPREFRRRRAAQHADEAIPS